MYRLSEQTIDFAWPADEVARQAEYATSCYAGLKCGTVQSGECLILSSDEDVLFSRLLEEATRALFAYFVKLTSPMEESFVAGAVCGDGHWQGLWGVGERVCGFSVERKRHGRSFAAERVAMVDRCAFEFLVCHIVAAWFEMSLQPEGNALFAKRLVTAQSQLLRNLAYLAEYSYSKSYTVIGR